MLHIEGVMLRCEFCNAEIIADTHLEARVALMQHNQALQCIKSAY